MAAITEGQRHLLWARAKAAGISTPSNDQLAALDKADVNDLLGRIAQGENVFGRAPAPDGRPERPSASVVDSRLADAIELLARAIDRLADRAGVR